MDEVSIHIRAVGSSNRVYNGGPEGATFPGWFISVSKNEGYDRIIEETQLTPEAVVVISEKLDTIVDNTDRSLWEDH